MILRFLATPATSLIAVGFASANPATSEPAPGAPPLTEQDIGTFLDGLVPYGMQRGWILRRHLGTSLQLSRQEQRLRLASRVGALALQAMVVGWLLFFVGLASIGTAVAAIGSGALDRWLTMLYVAGVVATLGAIAVLFGSVSRPLRGPGGWLVRTGEAVLTLTSLCGLWIIYQYGLASFSFFY